MLKIVKNISFFKGLIFSW